MKNTVFLETSIMETRVGDKRRQWLRQPESSNTHPSGQK